MREQHAALTTQRAEDDLNHGHMQAGASDMSNARYCRVVCSVGARVRAIGPAPRVATLTLCA
jgi:hypothetical protein